MCISQFQIIGNSIAGTLEQFPFKPSDLSKEMVRSVYREKEDLLLVCASAGFCLEATRVFRMPPKAASILKVTALSMVFFKFCSYISEVNTFVNYANNELFLKPKF